jgi:hypothetical protein
MVGYIQRLWGVHIDRGRSRIERGVRRCTDVPLQEALNIDKADWGLPDMSDTYFKDLMSEKFLCVRVYW